jgi:hypothetical protein
MNIDFEELVIKLNKYLSLHLRCSSHAISSSLRLQTIFPLSPANSPHRLSVESPCVYFGEFKATNQLGESPLGYRCITKRINQMVFEITLRSLPAKRIFEKWAGNNWSDEV